MSTPTSRARCGLASRRIRGRPPFDGADPRSTSSPLIQSFTDDDTHVAGGRALRHAGKVRARERPRRVNRPQQIEGIKFPHSKTKSLDSETY